MVSSAVFSNCRIWTYIKPSMKKTLIKSCKCATRQESSIVAAFRRELHAVASRCDHPATWGVARWRGVRYRQSTVWWTLWLRTRREGPTLTPAWGVGGDAGFEYFICTHRICANTTAGSSCILMLLVVFFVAFVFALQWKLYKKLFTCYWIFFINST